jgi:hypothetical protein
MSEPSKDLQIIEAMHRYGGSFVKALAQAASCADERNLHRLKIAFPDYWLEYDELAELHRKRAAVQS